MDKLQFVESLEIKVTQKRLREAVRSRFSEYELTREQLLKEMNRDLCQRAIDGCEELYKKVVSKLRCQYRNPPEYTQEGFCYNAGDSIIAMCRAYPHHVAKLAVRLVSDRTTVRLEVEDNGMGIDPDVEAYLFAESITSQKVGEIFFGGRGAHLHQASYEIRRLHGRIGCVNKGREKGAIFWYEIPLATILLP